MALRWGECEKNRHWHEYSWKTTLLERTAVKTGPFDSVDAIVKKGHENLEQIELRVESERTNDQDHKKSRRMAHVISTPPAVSQSVRPAVLLRFAR